MMQNLPCGVLVFSGCMIIYLFFLGITSYSPSFVPETSNGVYQAIVGNLPENYQRKFSSWGNVVDNTTNDDPWDRCELPKYDIWDEDIIPYFNPDNNPLIDCDKSFKPFTEIKNSSWKIVNSNKKLECKARCHSRKSDHENIIGNWSYKPGPVDCEILETVCSENKKDVYGYLHSQIIPKPPIEKSKIDTKGLMQFDVFVITLDSLSYSQARRSLPRTLSYFTNHMDGVLFPYMNKLGDNTRPNGIPIWFGKSLEKIDRTLFDEKVIPPDWTQNYFCWTFKDNETSLLSEFHDYGYRTLYAEDWPDYIMNWPNCVGFDKPPADHYMKPFQIAYERKGEAVTKKHLEGKLCRETHNALLDYMGQFTEAYPDQKKFGWIWAIHLGHNSENGFAHADKDFHNYLIKHRKQLDNSFVFILADHGLRFGSVRNTFVGALDVNNPFAALSIPKILRNTTKILEMMTENAKLIQSHYDTRATILDIMKYQSAGSFTETEPHQIFGEKGYSYIRKQPATPRNCRNMPVPLEYCLCQFKKTKLPTNTETAEAIGKALAAAVNTQITEGKFIGICIKMEWKKTLSLLTYDDEFKGATLYTVSAEMKEPSKAEFKANVKIINGEIKVLGTVERSNSYGKTADCIKSEYHRPYCYCKEQEDTKTTTKKDSDAKTTTKKDSDAKTTTKKDSDAKTTTKKDSDTKTTTKKDSDAKTTTKKDSDAKTTTKKDSDAKTTTKKDSDTKTTTKKDSDAKTTTKKDSDAKTTTKKDSDAKTTTKKDSDAKTTTKKDSDAKTTTKKDSDAKTTTKKDSDAKTTTKKDSDTKTTTKKDSDAKTTTKKDSDAKTTTKKDSDAKTTTKKDSDAKTTTKKDSDTKTTTKKA